MADPSSHLCSTPSCLGGLGPWSSALSLGFLTCEVGLTVLPASRGTCEHQVRCPMPGTWHRARLRGGSLRWGWLVLVHSFTHPLLAEAHGVLRSGFRTQSPVSCMDVTVGP